MILVVDLELTRPVHKHVVGDLSSWIKPRMYNFGILEAQLEGPHAGGMGAKKDTALLDRYSVRSWADLIELQSRPNPRAPLSWSSLTIHL